MATSRCLWELDLPALLQSGGGRTLVLRSSAGTKGILMETFAKSLLQQAASMGAGYGVDLRSEYTNPIPS
ncbi:hypothetical protein L915_05421 [Phytophthora nicotianae]|uniref:Uncharacterized protein n=1 Tax=Phytophthora nicotianae TaxID=4792 RepID=W2H6P6_PHYNI|nr:hypothetical protein L915_05421 [Phytophthora nicotianae]